MSFPHHDPNWQEAANFVDDHAVQGDTILAPDDFWRLFKEIHRYLNTRLKPNQDYHWAILHKGQLDQIDRALLARLSEQMAPVFANPVFVIWARRADLPSVSPESPHLISYFEGVERLPPASPIDLSHQPVLPDVGVISRFGELDKPAFIRAMDDFHRAGGYHYETLRDRVYWNEIDRLIPEMSGPADGRAILDMCCGSGRLKNIFPRAASVIGVDISDVAVEQARSRHIDTPTFSFQTMDVHNLEFGDSSFDVVLFIDAIEHVFDAERVIVEAERVLKSGGRLVLTAANTNGLNQIITRKLGHQTFLTNYQHVREFTFAEVNEMLRHAGMDPAQSTGIFLYPYWGVPGIDEIVRPLTDNDPEIVELFRVLGERAGPEYAYAFATVAHKP